MKMGAQKMNLEDYMDLCRHDFSSFVGFSFHELYPHQNYQHNWHIDVMAHHLTKVVKGECQKLIINVPPRMLKSHCASIALPAWVLGRDPRKKFLYLHAGKRLGYELQDEFLALVNSKRYRALFPHMQRPEIDKMRFTTHYGGGRQFVPIMGKLTGLGADFIVIDDPIGTDDVRDDTLRMRLHKQFDENILQRLNDKNNGAIILVMQRLHEKDLTAHLIAKNDGWVHLDLSAIALQDESWPITDRKFYHRKKGEVLHEAREPKEALMHVLKSVNSHAFSYQYLQGQYKPRFGDNEQGCLWFSPMRDNEFYDPNVIEERLHGFVHIDEKDLIKSQLFGIDKDIVPNNMRQGLTIEEIELHGNILREKMFERERMRESGELLF